MFIRILSNKELTERSKTDMFVRSIMRVHHRIVGLQPGLSEDIGNVYVYEYHGKKLNNGIGNHQMEFVKRNIKSESGHEPVIFK